MFILYAIVLGLIVGRLLGGRLDGLAGLSFRWVGLAIAGLTAQVLLFAAPATRGLDQIGPPLYVASTGAVLLFVLANIRVRGMAVVALGAGLNLVTIVANGGTMPASRAALETAGLDGTNGYTNSQALASPVLAPLGDVFALPAGIPLANVFSVGDVLIALGILVVIVAAMRRPSAAIDTPAPDVPVSLPHMAPAPAPDVPVSLPHMAPAPPPDVPTPSAQVAPSGAPVPPPDDGTGTTF
jgi:Family of unknown function (DUF5317)